MKCAVFVGIILCMAVQAGAETYSWVDENGTYNFTEDFSSVPKKYRNSAVKRGEMDGQPVEPPRAAAPAPGASGAPVAQKTATPAARDAADDGLFGGKAPEAWQQEMRPLYAEVKRLEQQLGQLEGLMRKPAGISKERFDGLAQEFKDVQKQYNEALKSYNSMNDAANKVGLPGEFRK